MKQSITIVTIWIVLLSIAFSSAASGQPATEEQSPQTIQELRMAIRRVLQETGTPAAGIALVDSTGPVWIEGLGMANREKAIPADAKTMFRIGSTSKIFVSLAILKLQEQGKLSLKDRVRVLVPEVKFENPWEETNPVLVEHLLEHTTGWDEIHLPELIHNAPDISLKDGLDLHPHSRISKWVPGTRTAYANSGPAVAAYIVERITGQPYEAYIQENFFTPMGMETMTFFLSKAYQQKGATLYKDGGYTQDYWHLLTRPSGAINASPKDMAKLLQLFIYRGKANATQLISKGSLRRMETPSTTLGAKAGLTYGYGLGLYTSDHNGFTYYKHGGSVGAGKSDFSYLPAYGMGYSIQTNSDNTAAIRRIGSLIRDYQTSRLLKPATTTAPSLAGAVTRPADGYYQQINFIKQLPFKLPSLLAERIWSRGDTLYNQFPAHVGQIVKFVPVGNGLYHNLHTGRPDLIVVNDPLAGKVLELAGTESGTVTLASVPGTLVFGRLAVFLLWIAFIVRAGLLLPFWLYRYWKGRIPGGANILVWVWPLVPVMFLGLAFVFLAAGAMEGKAFLAKPSFISIPVMLATIAFFATSVLSAIMAVSYRTKGIKKSVYFPAAFLSVLHLLVAVYLLWYGVIGLRTWA